MAPSTESNARAPFSGTVPYFLTALLATSARGRHGVGPLTGTELDQLANDQRRKRKKEKGGTRWRPIDSPSSILIRLPVNRPDVNTVHLIGTTGRFVFFPLIHLVIHDRQDAIDAWYRLPRSPRVLEPVEEEKVEGGGACSTQRENLRYNERTIHLDFFGSFHFRQSLRFSTRS